MKNEAIPRLRFNKFKEKWNKIPLNNIFKRIRNYVKPSKSTPLWSLVVSNGLIPKTKRFNRKFLVRKNKFNLVKSREFVYNPMNITLGTIDFNKLKNDICVSRYYVVMKLLSRYNDFFILEALKSQYALRLYKKYATGTLLEKQRLQFPTFSKIKFLIPALKEQQLIGKFFAKLDKLIQLQQKKVSLLKKLKRGYLQKLFPQPGTCFPSLRFNGFFKPWSCFKASTLFKSISEKNHPKLPVLSSTQTQGLVYRKDLNSDIKYNPKSLQNYKVIHKGDFVISLRSFQGGFECSNKLGIISAAYTVFNFINRSNQNTYFWKTFFKSYIFLQLLKKITFGIRDGKSIKFTGFKSLKLKYPSYKEEYKLGKLFKNMNNNIDIQKNKLIQLRKLKEAYLQKMFC